MRFTKTDDLTTTITCLNGAEILLYKGEPLALLDDLNNTFTLALTAEEAATAGLALGNWLTIKGIRETVKVPKAFLLTRISTL